MIRIVTNKCVFRIILDIYKIIYFEFLKLPKLLKNNLRLDEARKSCVCISYIDLPTY